MTFLQWVKKWSEWSHECNSFLSKNCPHVDSKGVEIHPSNRTTNLQHTDDLSLLDHLLTDPNFSSGWDSISKSEQAEIALMERLNKIKGCPLFV
jgi:hypothetical protein